jgi:hypothetical protein
MRQWQTDGTSLITAGRMITTRENQNTAKKTFHSTTFSNTDPTWTALGRNPRQREARWVTNHLNHGIYLEKMCSISHDATSVLWLLVLMASAFFFCRSWISDSALLKFEIAYLLFRDLVQLSSNIMQKLLRLLLEHKSTLVCPWLSSRHRHMSILFCP